MRKVVMIVLAVALALAMSGCDWFGPSVDQVSPADLKSYTASALFGTTEESVLMASEHAGFAATSVAIPMGDRVYGEMGTVASVGSFQDSFNVLLNRTVEVARASALAQARAIVVDENSDTSNPKDQKYDLKITITDETVNAATDFGIGASGTATVESFLLELSARVKETSDTAGEASGSGKQEMSVTYDEWTLDGEVIVHDGRVNTAGDGKVDVKVSEVGDRLTGSVAWRFRVEMSAGFSVSNLIDGRGGKLIMTFSYSGRENVTIDSANEDPFSTVTGEFEAALVVRLYDNSNTLRAEHTYTDDDVYDFVGF